MKKTSPRIALKSVYEAAARAVPIGHRRAGADGRLNRISTSMMNCRAA
jgi:hypothetical protein